MRLTLPRTNAIEVCLRFRTRWTLCGICESQNEVENDAVLSNNVKHGIRTFTFAVNYLILIINFLPRFRTNINMFIVQIAKQPTIINVTLSFIFPHFLFYCCSIAYTNAMRIISGVRIYFLANNHIDRKIKICHNIDYV